MFKKISILMLGVLCCLAFLQIDDKYIEEFLSSERFEEFLEMGDFPTELGDYAITDGLPFKKIVKSCHIS